MPRFSPMKLKNIWIQDIYLLPCASLSLSLKDTNKKRTYKYIPYYRYGLQNFWAFVHESTNTNSVLSAYFFFWKTIKELDWKKEKHIGHSRLFVPTQILYWITCSHISLLCNMLEIQIGHDAFQLFLVTTKFPGYFSPLRQKKVKLICIKKKTLPLRVYIAFRSLQLRGT